MKKLLLILTLLIASLPTMAGNYEALYDNVAAAASNAVNGSWNKISVNGRTFVLTDKSFRNDNNMPRYELAYKEADKGNTDDMSNRLYIRFYPETDKLEGHWTTDENIVEYVSKGVYKPSSNGGEDKEMVAAELGNHSVTADRKFLTNGGILQVAFIDFKTTRAQIKNKKGFAMNLIALVANVPTPMSYEIQQMVNNK